ncbi:MAG: DUF2442 domain-containing protein [Gemmatimonas sp.]|nr:DUF2442 domain-containing protein [Gemmatimonas sp.]
MEEVVERSWTPLDDEQLEREIGDARKQSKIANDGEPRAVSAHYNRRTRRIEVELVDGCLFTFLAKSGQGLEGATPDQLAEVEVRGDGYALHWESLDADFTVAGLLAGQLGSRAWMREHARRPTDRMLRE